MRSIEHFINGQSVADAKRLSDVWNPSQGEVQAQVGLGTAATLQKAVDAALAAQPAWAATNPQRRARVMFKFKELVEAGWAALAASTAFCRSVAVPNRTCAWTCPWLGSNTSPCRSPEAKVEPPMK